MRVMIPEELDRERAMALSEFMNRFCVESKEMGIPLNLIQTALRIFCLQRDWAFYKNSIELAAELGRMEKHVVTLSGNLHILKGYKLLPCAVDAMNIDLEEGGYNGCY